MTARKQSDWLRKNNLIRPGIYVPKEDWERFERAIAIVNYKRAKDDEPPLSRTDVIAGFIRQWSDKKIEEAP